MRSHLSSTAKKQTVQAGKKQRKVKITTAEILRLTKYAVDNGSDPAFLMAHDARFIYVNKAACKKLGYSEAELLTMTVHDIDTLFTKKIWPKHWADVKQQGSFTLQSVHKKKDGTTFPVEVTVNYHSFKGRDFNYAFARDLTAHKRAEAAVRESEEQFRNLSEQSPNMIFINSGGRVVYVNQKCMNTLGYERSAFYAPNFDFMGLIAPEDRQRVGKIFKRHMQGKEAPPYEYGLISKKGSRIDSLITTKLISFEGKRAILGIVTDITEIRRSQTELEKSTATLTEQKTELQDKTIALREILAQIEAEKLQIKKQVSATADKLLLPVVRKLRELGSPGAPKYLDLLELLEKNIQDLTSEFGAEVAKGIAGLAPRELEICNMIRGGMTSKEIADLLHLSLRTVETHRNHIRRKLGILGKKANLVTRLQQVHDIR